MSRPKNNSYSYEQALGTQSNIIDFVRNTPGSARVAMTPLGESFGVPGAAVVGGPPAFLEAHGIRYVPESPKPVDAEATTTLEDNLSEPISMSKVLSQPYQSPRAEDLDAKISNYLRLTQSSGSKPPSISSNILRKQRATEQALQSLYRDMEYSTPAAARPSSAAKLASSYGKASRASSMNSTTRHHSPLMTTDDMW